MKIVYLAAGAAQMYCGSCLHDNTLAAALMEQGHDVILAPTYTPIRTDETDVSQKRVFFGGINVYLQQKFNLFQRTPRVFDALLDRPSLIRLATRFGPGVQPERLGDLTVSMLAGEDGRQRKELRRLVSWLRHERPDVVHLSNAMLLGAAREIRKLGQPVVCTLSGEDIFLERLEEPFYSQARETLRERASDVSAFVALNHYYADFMADYLQVPRERIEVIPHGLNLAGHTPRSQARTSDVFHVGFLARICADKGLHLLVEAVERLLQDPSLPKLRLSTAGYLAPNERPYLRELEQRAARWPGAPVFEYAGEVTRDQKVRFLGDLDVMALPTVYRESKGIPALEAMASGVPVIVPDHGAFPEMIRDTQGGVLFPAGSATELGAAIRALALDRPRAEQLGRQGREAIAARYTARAMAECTHQLYETLVGKASPALHSGSAR